MSTNKTDHYDLHAWELGDDFLLSEINENFAALDGKAVQISFGAYQGNGASAREISLGFTPQALLVSDSNGVFDTSYAYNGGLTLRGFPSIMGASRRLLEIVEGGFKVYYDGGGSPSCSSNHKEVRYY